MQQSFSPRLLISWTAAPLHFKSSQQLAGHRPIGCAHPERTKGGLWDLQDCAVTYTACSGEEFHTPTGRPTRCRHETTGPPGRPGKASCGHLSTAGPRGAARGAGHASAQVRASTPRAGAAPTLRFRRPLGSRPPPPQSAPPPASRSSTRTLGPRAPRWQNFRPSSPPLGGGRGESGRNCGAEMASLLRSTGPGPPSEVGRLQTPACQPGSHRPGPRRPILTSSCQTFSLPLIPLVAHLPTRLPAVRTTNPAQVPGPQRREIPFTAALRSATELWAPPSRRPDQQMGGAATAVGFPLDKAAEVGGALGRPSLTGIVFNPVSSSWACPARPEASKFFISTGVYLCPPVRLLQVPPMVLLS